jgi:hypothetical protein
MKADTLAGLMPPEPPPLPAADPWPYLALALLLALCALAAWAWWSRPARRRLRRLDRVQGQLERAKGDPAGLAGQLQALLQEAIGPQPLLAERPPAGVPAEDWHRLLTALQEARFAPHRPDGHRLSAQIPLLRQLLRQGHGVG